jgi:hypothetical protein
LHNGNNEKQKKDHHSFCLFTEIPEPKEERSYRFAATSSCHAAFVFQKVSGQSHQTL